jgi:hypothetical protein
MSAAELEDSYWFMERQWKLQTPEAAEAIGGRRVELGYRLPALRELHPSIQFYMDAYPGMCASILQLMHRPVLDAQLALWCANEALSKTDPNEEQQVKAAQSLREFQCEIR